MSKGCAQHCRSSKVAVERGESMVEVVVAIFLLAASVVLLGAGASLWQSGMRWATERYEKILVLHSDLVLWPPEPQAICGVDEPKIWWEQISFEQSLRWDQPVVWVIDQGWIPIPTDSCDWIATGEVHVIKIRSELLDTVISVQRP
jgi:hypothetical protein